MEKRILVVDDNPDICLVIKKILNKAGYKAYIAKNGKEGIKQPFFDSFLACGAN